MIYLSRTKIPERMHCLCADLILTEDYEDYTQHPQQDRLVNCTTARWLKNKPNLHSHKKLHIHSKTYKYLVQHGFFLLHQKSILAKPKLF